MRILYLINTLAIGDVICLSPLIEYAVENGMGFDFVYREGSPEAIAKLLYPKELREGKLRLLKAPEGAYEITIIGDRRLLLQARSMGKNAGTTIPVPVQSVRKKDLFIYNCFARPLLALSGCRPRKMLPNPGKRLSSILLEEICEVMGKTASHDQLLERVAARLGVKPTTEKTILVHLFRDVPYRRLDQESMRKIAAALAANYPKSKITVMAGNGWEAEQAAIFAKLCADAKLDAGVIRPKLEEIPGLAARAQLYVGVDHGATHLATLAAPKSLVLYGGSRHYCNMHLIWPPQAGGPPEKITENITIMHGKLTALIIHPSEKECLAERTPNPKLINSIVTNENLKKALGLVK
jgi:ADP-heptose:LPS heptosyltransferase